MSIATAVIWIVAVCIAATNGYLVARNRKYRAAMQHIMQVLGPKAVCRCHGCSWETNEAISTLNDVGITYQFRKGVVARIVKHDTDLEELGNRTATPE